MAEPISFEVFFDGEARVLFRRLCAITGNSAEAEEIMQDAFLALWERWDRVSRLEDPTGYLYRTAMNVFRRRTRRAALAIRRAVAFAPEPREFSEIDEQQDVLAALSELTPRQRAALVLTEVLGYSSEEAERALGIRATTRVGQGWDPTVSPDGSRIAYGDPAFGLTIENLDGTHVQHLFSGVPGPWNPLPYKPRSAVLSTSSSPGATRPDMISYTIAALVALGLAVLWIRRKRLAPRRSAS